MMISNRGRLPTLIGFAIVFSAFAGLAGSARGEVTRFDGVAAVVNDRKIMRSDVEKNVATLYRKLIKTCAGDELKAKMDEAYREGLEDLIERAIILSSCEDPNPAMVDKMTDEQMDQIVNGGFRGDRAAFLQALAEEHISLKEWRSEVRDNILVSALSQREVTSRIVISPDAAKRAYEADIDKYKLPEQVKLRMIGLKKGVSEADTALQKQTADGLIRRVEAGEEFSVLEKEFSGDGGAEGGADPGWVVYADLKKELAAAVAGLKVGEVSRVVETGDSFFVVRVEDRRAARVPALEDVRDEIERRVRQDEFVRLYDAWIARLRKRAYVKVIGDADVP